MFFKTRSTRGCSLSSSRCACTWSYTAAAAAPFMSHATCRYTQYQPRVVAAMAEAPRTDWRRAAELVGGLARAWRGQWPGLHTCAVHGKHSSRSRRTAIAGDWICFLREGRGRGAKGHHWPERDGDVPRRRLPCSACGRGHNAWTACATDGEAQCRPVCVLPPPT